MCNSAAELCQALSVHAWKKLAFTLENLQTQPCGRVCTGTAQLSSSISETFFLSPARCFKMKYVNGSLAPEEKKLQNNYNPQITRRFIESYIKNRKMGQQKVFFWVDTCQWGLYGELLSCKTKLNLNPLKKKSEEINWPRPNKSYDQPAKSLVKNG